MMGDKITAKQTVKELGIPTVPGSDGEVSDADAAQDGGRDRLSGADQGHGRRRRPRHEGGARMPANCPSRCPPARTEAKAAFGNDTVYMEKYLQKPRHIEIQILADSHGHVVHLGERDCSLQRRHQKVWEEAGSPRSTPRSATRSAASCTSALEKLGYLGAGTIEFLYEDGRFYFIEMNTRLQVEHPVTEAITGIDIVREQIRIAAGARPGLHPEGHRVRRPCHRMPHQCGKSLHLPPLARHRSPSSTPRAAWACASIPRSIPAIASRPITTAWRAS